MRRELRQGSLLLDAAMGTALLARGLVGRAPAWNLTHPGEVLAVHRAHVAAGADVVLTNTFVGATREEAAAAIQLARASGARFVAGSLFAGLTDLETQLRQLEGVDGLWLETATTQEQAERAVRMGAASGLPVAITCAMQRADLTRLRALGAEAAGYNCSPWPDDPGGADILKPDAAGLEPLEWARRVPQARLRGGCCGTSASYLEALRAMPR